MKLSCKTVTKTSVKKFAEFSLYVTSGLFWLMTLHINLFLWNCRFCHKYFHTEREYYVAKSIALVSFLVWQSLNQVVWNRQHVTIPGRPVECLRFSSLCLIWQRTQFTTMCNFCFLCFPFAHYVCVCVCAVNCTRWGGVAIVKNTCAKVPTWGPNMC